MPVLFQVLSFIPVIDFMLFAAEYIADRSVFVVDIVYAPLVGGFCSVLSDGRAALLTSPSSRFHPQVSIHYLLIPNDIFFSYF